MQHWLGANQNALQVKRADVKGPGDAKELRDSDFKLFVGKCTSGYVFTPTETSTKHIPRAQIHGIQRHAAQNCNQRDLEAIVRAVRENQGNTHYSRSGRQAQGNGLVLL